MKSTADAVMQPRTCGEVEVASSDHCGVALALAILLVGLVTSVASMFGVIRVVASREQASGGSSSDQRVMRLCKLSDVQIADPPHY
jgi:hypothetical protein